MSDRDLAWRVEETCHNAWPGLRQVMVGDWVLRFADGVSRRANSANPLHAQAGDLDAVIAVCRDLFPAQGRPVLFRIPSLLDPAVDAHLASLGYTDEGETRTLYADMTALPSAEDPEIEIAPRPTPDWLAAMMAAQGWSAADGETYGRIVGSIVIPAAFVGLRVDGQLAALTYGAVHDRLLCFESVITAEAFRGRGFARRMLTAIFAWGRSAGAEGACLQVEATNDPAVALYTGLGLKTELYRYHYRRAPKGL